MGKKIWYSKPLSEMWAQYNKFYRQTKGTVEEFYNEKNRQIRMWPGATSQDVQCHESILDLWRLDKKKKFMHIYFKTKELRDFLANMRLADLTGIVDFLFKSGTSFTFRPSENNKNSHESLEIEKIQGYSFGIHVPYEKEEKGYAFQLLYNESHELAVIWAVGQNEGWCSADNYKCNLQRDDERSAFKAKIFRLAVNTIAYMKVFPECVKDGVPSTEENECSCILEVADKVLEPVMQANSNKMISPHYRKGYFKMLRSDYYTHKKGQIIFIPETMVNGMAKTVEKSSNEKKLKDFEAE